MPLKQEVHPLEEFAPWDLFLHEGTLLDADFEDLFNLEETLEQTVNLPRKIFPGGL